MHGKPGLWQSGAVAATPFGSHATLTDGLIAWWKMDEESGVREDSHGVYDLDDNNTVLFDAGLIGNAAKFVNGNDEYFDRDQIPGLEETMSISLFLKTIDSGRGDIIAGGVSTVSNGWALECNVFGAGDVNFFLGANYTIYSRTATGKMTNGDWTHIVITYDGTEATENDRPNIWVNGVDESLTHVGTPPAELQVGNDFRVASSLNRSADALIDLTGVWDRVLTSDEISDLRNSGAGLGY
jgi:hypothetical protein